MKVFLQKHTNYLIFLLVLLFLISLKIINPSFIKSVSYLSFDLYQKVFAQKKDSEVVIIDIDEESLGKFGQFPWNRNVFAKILDQLNTSNPKAIGFDIFFTEKDKQSPDEIIKSYDLIPSDVAELQKLKGPDEASDDTFGNKLSRTVTAGILNSSLNCPNYVERAKQGASQLLTKIMPRTPIATRMRRGLAARRQATRERAVDTMQRNFRRRQNIRSGRENVRRGGGKKKTKRKKCIRRATKRLNKCWKKKKRHTFKKCWKKGRKKYKACKKKTKRRG